VPVEPQVGAAEAVAAARVSRAAAGAGSLP
jgi:hypothetical protein